MNEKLRQNFIKAVYEPEAGLCAQIWRTTLHRTKRDATLKFWAFFVIGASAAVALVPMFLSLSASLVKSGFGQYFSLAFSTGGAITSYWREFMLSLAESLPLGEIIMSLALVLVFALSLRYALRQFIKGQLKFS